VRLGLSATAAAAVLYGAIILFGLGSASPSALSPNGESRTPVVHLPHDSAASGPALRLPQVSPGPGRQRSRKPSPSSAGSITTVSAPLTEQPGHPVPASGEPPAAAVSAPSSPAAAPSTQAAEPSVVEVTVTVAEVTLPEVTLPPVTLPPVPAVPPLPPVPSLPLP
jgi:hypothetical protein